jgi:hypothetical protein
MAREIYQSQSIVEKISPRDKEVILLAPVFFWAKYTRRKINLEGFEPDVQEVDFNDPISILRAGFDLQRQANSDIDGDIVGAVSDTISRHPKRNEFFPHLTDEQIQNICNELNNIFENQEYCAQCEAWSYYDQDPKDFAINIADSMLLLKGRQVGLLWFSDIFEWKNRQQIMKTVLREKLVKRASGLLPARRE